ncbi:hypothetical protein [Legionella longbeachae]|uniref:hypothetical protein n=1 Tax=Legionella longbeachae TaxID=450 RepID=UPI0005A07635|nr:hypothetical protein [Legionella longbeachae]HBD7399366.1 hypothetical protein [Legionella pneumophila]ARB91497.1 hypothetical protein A6J40_04550 [Legionella longbeachae]ARM32076.1 hypothetical protein B0B39_00315 [Legionella longbeachae]QEY51298.1 hypothetical protein FQU71_08565 [Legionella longbeachae]QIN32081.1 hypothetical protein GCB94_07930 [Legionella longbeachae]
MDFAIYKSLGGVPCGGVRFHWGGRELCVGALNALRALCKVRTNDFIPLENDLKPSNLVENQYKI